MKLISVVNHFAITALVLCLPLLYLNCSGKVGSPANYLGDGSSPNLGANFSTTYTGAAGTSGALPSLQDRTFSFTPIHDAGPFTVSGLPSWAKFNSTTGVVTGIPLKLSDSALFTVTGAQGTYGPYAVSVTGNPLKEYQWHLKNTGQTAFALTPGTAGEDIHMTNTVARGLTGTGVRVAFSDTGVFIAHQALAANVLGGESRNYLNTAGGYVGDPTPDLTQADYGHGTAVATIALEKGWTGQGGRGVAPDAKFAAFLFIEAQDALSQAGQLTQAIADQFRGNFDIFNYSWTDPQCTLKEYPATVKDKIRAGVMTQRGGRGSIYLMAGGNNYLDDIQSCYSNMSSSTVFDNVNFSEINTNPYVINVAAVNALGVSSSYSTPGSALWISAPGGEFGWDTTVADTPQSAFMPAIIGGDFYGCSSGIKTENAAHSAFDRGSPPNLSCKYTSTMNGTSAATPVISGAVALILQVNPNLTWRDVKYILAKTADKINPGSNPSQHPSTTFNLSGYSYDQPWITNAAGFNFHNYYGFGRVNVDNAVSMAQAYSAGSLGTYQESNWANDSGAINAAIPDASATGVTRTLAVSSALHIEAVQLRVSTTGCAGDTGLELTSPSGTKSILMNINSRIADGAIQDHTFLSNAFYGETANGTWTLRVIDGFAGCTASLSNWKLNFGGH